jgi:hypothetical protein
MPEKMMRSIYYQPIAMKLVESPERDDFVESLVAEIKYKERDNKTSKRKDKSIIDEED